MPVKWPVTRILSLILRLAELGLSIAVVGLVFWYVAEEGSDDSLEGKDAAYIIPGIINGLTGLEALVFLILFQRGVRNWYWDFVSGILLAICGGIMWWFQADKCKDPNNTQENVSSGDYRSSLGERGLVDGLVDKCFRLLAAKVCIIIVAICFILSGILGYFWDKKTHGGALKSMGLRNRRRRF